LQHVLYRAAKADPGRRFHALFDKVCRRDVLDRAWEEVRRNRGAAGIDRVSLADAEEYGVTWLLGELAAELKQRRYRPLPARRVFIPKPGTSEQRPLSIPAVRDRVVQAALKIVLEPVVEADFAPCNFGFRPGLSAHDALQVLINESWRGRRWVVETGIASCFSAIPHDRLMQAIGERVCDRAILALIRTLLRAGVMEGGSLRRSAAGTPPTSWPTASTAWSAAGWPPGTPTTSTQPATSTGSPPPDATCTARCWPCLPGATGTWQPAGCP
jgi:RNA-directed DNA polymerase